VSGTIVERVTMVAVKLDATKPNPMTAITCDHDDLLIPRSPSLTEIRQALNEARHKFLEAKDRYFKLKRLLYLRRIEAQRRLQKLEELARLRGLRPQEPAGPSPHNPAGADAERARLSRELNDNILFLRKLKRLIQLRQMLLRRQKRRHAEEALRQDPELRENVLKLQKLKRLVALRQSLLQSQRLALSRHDYTGAVQPMPDHDLVGNAARKPLGDPQRKPTRAGEPKEPQDANQFWLRDLALPSLTAEGHIVRGPPLTGVASKFRLSRFRC
jgi:hypothetical protein